VVNVKDKPDDYRRCPDGQRHIWFYGGKQTQKYICQLCDVGVSKASLKAATDA